ncbi:MAG TPA: 5-formyltetrahydrofolate cyclo-ligase [Bacteroidaceae bacterium]|nr:5-formyltetrahydrofolate cyclo-ligase [Bacteroidaceae bacterium]HPX98482.1 5-formyltetrahydrofolate cyclo-ligase [Bacteroidaceae bacterium]HQL26287.1 5-formyltetrahydrofolate cyclo-ligase [Bacteroidaceae bacterium]
MTPEQKTAQSRAVWERLEQTGIFRSSTDILIYWSMDDEVRTPPFIEKWRSVKRFYLPSVQGDTLVVKRYTGSRMLTQGEQFGIPEPEGEAVSDLSPITLVIVPGRAFDKQGHRLGRGRGFYDRLLPLLPHAVKAGACFDCQKLPSVPTDENDIKMDFII